MSTPAENDPTTLKNLMELQQQLMGLMESAVDIQSGLSQNLTALGKNQVSMVASLEFLTDFVKEQRGFNNRVEASIVSTGERVDGIESKLNGLRDDIGLVKGGHARNAMRQNLARVADEFGFDFISEVPQAAVIGFSKVATAQSEAANEAESFRNADMVMNVMDSAGNAAYVALEASFTVNGNDVRRSVRNAAYLRQYTGLPCHAAVAGVEVLPEAQDAVDAGQVLFYRIPARELQSE